MEVALVRVFGFLVEGEVGQQASAEEVHVEEEPHSVVEAAAAEVDVRSVISGALNTIYGSHARVCTGSCSGK